MVYKRTYIAVLLGLVFGLQAVQADDSVERGRRIYQDGQLPSGTLLTGKRLESMEIKGLAAACVTCHRSSGMGGLEATIDVPPISGRFLFDTEREHPVALLDPRAPKNLSQKHAPYTEDSLRRALREGINAKGQQMSALMPRYNLSRTEIRDLTRYLRQLSSTLAPGVETDTVRMATVIAPGVDPGRRDALIKMLQTAFQQRNASQAELSGRMRMPLDLIPRTKRDWELVVWDLVGPANTWTKQLTEHFNREPAFAVVSGLSDTTWAPVQEFCRINKVPCLFPSVPMPPEKTDFYSLYFSQGVILEAKVLGKYLTEEKDQRPQRVIQIHGDEPVGRQAAYTLATALRTKRIISESRILRSTEATAIAQALHDLTPNDVVTLWISPAVLKELGPTLSKRNFHKLFVSSVLSHGELSSLSGAENSKLRVISPYELGGKRDTNIADLTAWLKTWSLPFVDENLQSEVFFNLLFLTDLSSQLLDNFYEDYLIEKAEDMLGMGSNVSVYPHLSLASKQRFASKGAYIARWDKDRLIPASEWIVP